jgi:hypothetical protein
LFAGEVEVGGGVGGNEVLAAEPGEEAADAAEAGDLSVDDEGFVAAWGSVMVKEMLIGGEVGAGEVGDLGGFCAWLGLCPCNAISGGKLLSRKTRKIKNNVREALRLAAFGLEKSQSKMGEYCRRMKGRLGKASGITATAHKIARIIYSMIASGQPYQEEIAFKPNRNIEKKQQNQLMKLAQKFGYQLTPTLDVATS